MRLHTLLGFIVAGFAITEEFCKNATREEIVDVVFPLGSSELMLEKAMAAIQKVGFSDDYKIVASMTGSNAIHFDIQVTGNEQLNLVGEVFAELRSYYHGSCSLSTSRMTEGKRAEIKERTPEDNDLLIRDSLYKLPYPYLLQRCMWLVKGYEATFTKDGKNIYAVNEGEYQEPGLDRSKKIAIAGVNTPIQL